MFQLWSIYNLDPLTVLRFGADAFTTTPMFDSEQSSIEVIGIRGTIVPRSNWYPAATEVIAKRLDEALANPTIEAIVFDIDSPGGAVFGVPELAAKIRDAGKVKATVGVINHVGASAAYWLASQMNTLVAAPSSIIGSIGVKYTHVDMSGMLEKEGYKVTEITTSPKKAEASPYRPLSEADRESLLAQAQQYHDLFVAAVATGRRTTSEKVELNYGQGGIMIAADAKTVGMIDRIDTLSNVLADLESREARKQRMKKIQLRAPNG